MIFHFILNPKSGKKHKQQSMEDAIKEACQKRRLSYHIYYTTCLGDATEYVSSMVRISNDRQRFICVGGDGTLNEVVNSAPCNPNVEFGIIPNGSGNDFVRNFTCRNLFSSIDAQIDGEPISLDLIKCNENYCVNMANIGFDCAVAKEAASLKKIKFITAKFAYTLGVFKLLLRKIGTEMKIILDNGAILDGIYTLTAIGNGRYCGGGYCAAPLADMRDGIMDLCIIKKVSKFNFLRLVGSYKSGKHLSNKRAMKYIRYERVSHFKMEFKEPLPVCLDGEIKGAKNIDFSVVRNAFNFIIPKSSELI